MSAGTALFRRPSRLLAEGLVTHITRSTSVDVNLARRQHDAYMAAIASSGWAVREVAPAEDCPDSVFIEDIVVVVGSLAIVVRPGAPQRRPEVAAVEETVRDLGLDVVRIEEPGTLDGGDILQVGTTVYVGRGGRTNAEGIRQVRRHLAARLPDRTVVAVPLGRVLHLKSAVTALPDHTVLAWPGSVNAALFPSVRAVGEQSGCHVLPLGDDRVLIAASAPRTAALLDDVGFEPVVVDISEFEKLEGCVTCMTVLISV